ncbi:DUF3592 domain-containing protein [Amycolatopsis pithecellobii]|uniref:DUF3592 domain-containing protein n=1 Tax=Amycolatopsis pithecellobii TaxID=664692 RepID=A0A6N7ZAW0_9PSEU|nr:DUF3592 domain-containing protein [Amycolatopsis pithecellobii]MTD58901.1 hypothetical protein [Amycolatopsis pithecellobii]
MELGAGLDRDADVRRYRRTRNHYFGIFLVLLIASGVVLGGGISGLLGESPVEVNVIGGLTVIFVLLALPAVFTAVKAVQWNKRVKERLGATGTPSQTWVPAGPGETVDGDVDLPAQVSRLGMLALRSTGVMVVFAGLLVGGIMAGIQSSHEGEELLQTGARVTGTVVSVAEPAKSSWTITVDYPVGATWRKADIRLETKREFVPGQEVLVIYDREDPGRVRTPLDDNTGDVQLSLFVEPMLAGLAGIPFGAMAMVRWARRYRAVRQSGWHAASVLVAPGGRISARYVRGGELQLDGVLSTHRAARFATGEPRKAWIGGEASTMVVLFSRENGKKPYAVPVRAAAPLSPARRVARRRRARGHRGPAR